MLVVMSGLPGEMWRRSARNAGAPIAVIEVVCSNLDDTCGNLIQIAAMKA